MPDGQKWKELLGLRPHPEGGFYREAYRSRECLPPEVLPGRCPVAHRISTAIYFMLTRGEFSAFHRLRSDEIWHHYDGASAVIHVIAENGEYRNVRLGKAAERGERPLAAVGAGEFFAAEPAEGPGDFFLVGCTVAPGFEFGDFELSSRSSLLLRFPRHRELILRLTREGGNGGSG